jgi:hypothetical protein
MIHTARPGGRSALASGLLAVVVVASGCASVVDGSGQVAGPASGSSGSSGASASVPDFPSESATPSTIVAPTPVAPSTPPPTTQAPLPSADITDLHYKVPTGFVKGKGYHPVRPLESQYVAAYAVPKNEQTGLDVLSILLYRLPHSRAVGTIAQQKARVRAYNREANAKRLSAVTVVAVGGRPALEMSLSEPPDYRYVAWFVFSTRHVLQVTCQVDQAVSKIAHACGKWVESITLS